MPNITNHVHQTSTIEGGDYQHPTNNDALDASNKKYDFLNRNHVYLSLKLESHGDARSVVGSCGTEIGWNLPSYITMPKNQSTSLQCS